MELITDYFNKKDGFSSEKKYRAVLMNSYTNSPLYISTLVNQPHFLVQKNGKVYHLNNEKHLLPTMNMQKGNIYIAIANKGHLVKDGDKFFDMFSIEYKLPPFEKKWKQFVHWDEYTEEQYSALNSLLKLINIEGNVVKNGNMLAGIKNFKGVCCRANFDDMYNDVTPAFNFDKITINGQ